MKAFILALLIVSAGIATAQSYHDHPRVAGEVFMTSLIEINDIKVHNPPTIGVVVLMAYDSIAFYDVEKASWVKYGKVGGDLSTYYEFENEKGEKLVMRVGLLGRMQLFGMSRTVIHMRKKHISYKLRIKKSIPLTREQLSTMFTVDWYR